MQIGFVGLGTMGRPIATHLLDAGHTLKAYARSPLDEPLASRVGRLAHSAGEVAAAAEVVFLMVRDTPDVDEVAFGERGLVHHVTPGSVIVDLSSVSPAATRGFAERMAARGVAWIDAPVSGGEVGARERTLSAMCGGEVPAFERVRPLLACFAQRIRHLGPAGAGQACKLVNQVVVALNLLAVAEGLALARHGGVEPALARDAMLGGFAESRCLQLHGGRMVSGDFEPGFALGLHLKDLRNAMRWAADLGAHAPALQAVLGLFEQAAAQGWGGHDHSVVARLYGADAGPRQPDSASLSQ